MWNSRLYIVRRSVYMNIPSTRSIFLSWQKSNREQIPVETFRVAGVPLPLLSVFISVGLACQPIPAWTLKDISKSQDPKFGTHKYNLTGGIPQGLRALVAHDPFVLGKAHIDNQS